MYGVHTLLYSSSAKVAGSKKESGPLSGDVTHPDGYTSALIHTRNCSGPEVANPDPQEAV